MGAAPSWRVRAHVIWRPIPMDSHMSAHRLVLGCSPSPAFPDPAPGVEKQPSVPQGKGSGSFSAAREEPRDGE